MIFMKYLFQFSVASIADYCQSIEKDNDGNYIIGDMIFSPALFNECNGGPTHSSGRKSKKYRWSNGIVPYVLDNSLTDQQKGIIRVAVKEINQEMGGCIEIRYYLV